MKNIWKRIYEIAFLHYSKHVCSETAGNCFKQRCVVVDHEEWTLLVHLAGKAKSEAELVLQANREEPTFSIFECYLAKVKGLLSKLEAAIQPF